MHADFSPSGAGGRRQGTCEKAAEEGGGFVAPAATSAQKLWEFALNCSFCAEV